MTKLRRISDWPRIDNSTGAPAATYQVDDYHYLRPVTLTYICNHLLQRIKALEDEVGVLKMRAR